MCQQIFLGATTLLPAVTYNESRTSRYPYLGVYGPLEDSDSIVQRARGVLNLPFVYYLSGQMSCGCGFYYEGGEELAEMEAFLHQRGYTEEQIRLYAAAQAPEYYTVTSLGRYLADHRPVARIRLYVTCTHTEGQEAIAHTQTVTPTFFGGASFPSLPEQSLFDVELEVDAC
jgi:hypothetical protein